MLQGDSQLWSRAPLLEDMGAKLKQHVLRKLEQPSRSANLGGLDAEQVWRRERCQECLRSQVSQDQDAWRTWHSARQLLHLLRLARQQGVVVCQGVQVQMVLQQEQQCQCCSTTGAAVPVLQHHSSSIRRCHTESSANIENAQKTCKCKVWFAD